jgi:two-component system, OmpR family, phosphate regulon response regulator OmpR
MQRLLMIDDDARLANMVRDYLAASGFAVEIAGDVATGVAALRTRPAELLILDLMLPDGDGLEVCRRLRADGVGIPILMLTAKGDPIDRVIGLEVGADDYLPKPFEPRELQARVKALLRRAGGAPADTALRFGRLEIDRDARLVRVDGEVRALTSHQFELLVTLAERAGRVLTREQLMDLVRGEALEAFDRSIDVHIARIRAAIEDDPRHPTRIITVRGAGYVFARTQDVA